MFAHRKIYVNGPTDITKRWQEHVEPVGSNTSRQVNQKGAGANKEALCAAASPAACCPGYQPGRNDLGIVFTGPGSPRTPSGLSPRVLRGAVEAEVSSDGHHRVSFESRRQRENENRSEEDGEEDLLVHVHTEENSCCTRAHLSKQRRSGGVPLWFWLPEKGNRHEWPG